MDLSDEALLERFRQTQDPTLYKSLVRRYQTRIFNAAYRILGSREEAEEVVQETCLRVHQNISKFKTNSLFAAWIFRIAHNCCLDILRTKQRRRGFHAWSFDPQAPSGTDEDSLGVLAHAADPGLSPDNALELREEGEMVLASLSELSEQQRTVVVLHDIEGFSYQEIADIIGASVGTVRSRLYYGRQRLREILEPYFSSRPATNASR